MTKKIFVGMSAMAMLFATSCQDDMNLPGNVGETTTVAFNVSTPEIGTRAYSDGQTTTVLQYAVYDAQGNILPQLKKMDATIDIKANVELELTTGDTYTVIFWAEAPYAPYDVDFEAKTMTVDYTDAVSNDENRDAFYAAHTFTVSGAQTENVQLRRPFAQLNIGTSDYANADKAGYTPTKSAVTVKTLGNTLNLWDGTVSGNPEEVIVNFDYADIVKTEVFPVDDTKYDYLAMNYLLVGADQEVVDIEFGYTETDANAAKTRTVGSVPVQRNYRTNIYGKLLTSTVDVNVEIEPEYNGALTADDLQLAAAVGGEVTLENDIELDAPLNVQANMTLNLNGKTITAANAKGDGAVIEVAEGVSAKLVGGTIKSTKYNGDAAINNAGELVLENITIEGAPLADGDYSAYAVISSGKLTIGEGVNVSADRGCLKFSGAGETVINGGNFTNNDISPRSLTSHVVDVENGGTHKLTINGGTFKHLHATTSGGVVICNRTKGTVYVNGGNFSGGNYYGNNNLSDYGYGGTFVVTGGTYSAKPAAKYIAAGYNVVVKDSKYYVVPEEAAVVTTAEELGEAINEGKTTIALTAGTYVIPNTAKGKTLAFVGTGNPEDVKVAVTKVGNGGENCDYGLDGSTVTFDGVTITTNSSTYIGYARCNGTYNNCVINGTYTLYGESVFNNCEFNVSGDVYNIWTWGAPKATFNNCTFNCDGKSMLLYGQANTKLTMNNCVFNDNGGLNELKAAIEIGNDYNTSYELIVNNATVNGFAINDKGINTNTTLWANKNSMGNDKLNVVVDGVDVY